MAQHCRVWPSHYGSGNLYNRTGENLKTYQVWTQEDGRTTYELAGEIINATKIPPDALPAGVRRQFPVGCCLLTTTTRQIATEETTPYYHTAKELFASLEP